MKAFEKLLWLLDQTESTNSSTLNKYNGKKARHGLYNFMDIKVISAGERDPDADGVEGMSASKMRSAASDNDFTAFAQGLPKEFSNSDSKALFNAVRKGLGLKEETNLQAPY